MGAKAEALAQKFEAKVQEATGVMEKLSDADWKKVTSAEKWPVGVTAHHIAEAHQIISGIVKAVAGGQSMPPFTMDALNAMNAKHATDFAGCSKSETIAYHKKNAEAAAAVVRGVNDADLGKSATVITGAPAMSAEQLCGLLAGHIDEHLTSIKTTVGA